MKIGATTYYNLLLKTPVVFVLFPTAMLLMVSCTHPPEMGLPANNKMVILAEITAGDSAYIPIARSIDVGNGSPIQFARVRDASVIITGADGATMNPRLNEDAVFNDVPGSVYSSPASFSANTDYSIQITHPEWGVAEATTHIPASFVANGMTIESGDLAGKEVVDFRFSIQDNADEENYYILEALKRPTILSHYFIWQGVRYDYDTKEGKQMHETIEDDEDVDIPILEDTTLSGELVRLHLFTKDKNTDNAAIGPADSSFNRIFISDQSFNGQSFATGFAILQSEITPVNPNEIGTVIIRVKSVHKDFYNYMLQYEKYRSNLAKLPAEQLFSPKGNIRNGLGIFGGSYKNEWKFYYEDLE